jgi:tetratricopeptide (TPR) repeat protein
MSRRFLFAFLVAALVSVPVQANLLDTWQEVQASLVAGDDEGFEQALNLLQDQAVELDVRRMTAFSAALVTWAETHPGAGGEAALRAAKQLDSKLPTPYFLDARWSWEKGARVAAVQEYAKGWISLFRYGPSRRIVAAWLIMWTLFSVACAIVAMIVIVTLRNLRGMVFDSRDLGGRLFKSANAWVFAFVILLLPVFAGLGPIWLVVYLFVLSWIYLSQYLRIWAFVACLVLSFIPPAFVWVQQRLLRSDQLMTRVVTVLEERQADFSTLREFAEMETEFEDLPDYHILLGELLRMHGEPGMAKLQFQKATLLDPGSARPLVFVANLALEEGNTQRAIQFFNQAIELDARNAFAYHNLSLGFDLTRRFQEGDAARAKARELGGRGVADDGLRGLDPRIRYPRLGRDDVERLVSQLSPEQQASVGIISMSLDPLKQFASPLSIVFVVGAFLGLAVLLIRLRIFPPARECSKCGKVYRLEAGYGESTVYCSQCVSVFMKRDVVSIEQQTAKLNQIRRWEGWTLMVRRLTGFLVPGSADVLDGRVIRGFSTGLLAWFALAGALVWIPLFVPRIEPLAAISQVQIGFIVLFALLTLKSGISAWNRR